MQKLTLGQLTFVADASGVAVTADGREEPVMLSRGEVSQLELFLRLHGTSERRIGFRVPMEPLAESIRQSFRVQIRVGARILVARCVDLSLTGILVEVTGVAVPRGAEIPIRLNLDDIECRLIATVVRAEDDQIAMHFLQSLKNGELNPPEPLLVIYRSLETEWLRTRRAED